MIELRDAPSPSCPAPGRLRRRARADLPRPRRLHRGDCDAHRARDGRHSRLDRCDRHGPDSRPAAPGEPLGDAARAGRCRREQPAELRAGPADLDRAASARAPPSACAACGFIADGIPATMPDGQGQVSHFDLASAERIEVLRGPFSVLYGNASGGVINVVHARTPPAGPTPARRSPAAAYDTWRAAASSRGAIRRRWHTPSRRAFRTDGYRDHSAAKRTAAMRSVRWRGERRRRR